MKSKRRTAALLAALVLLCGAVLGACSAGSPNQIQYSQAEEVKEYDAAPMESAPANGADSLTAAYESGEMALTGAAAPRPSEGEKLIENLYYQIETLDFDDAAKQLENLYQSLGGYVQEANVDGSSFGGLRSAHYVLRIPQEKAAQAKEKAGSLGNVIRTETSTQNVTDEYYDIEARLKSLRAQEERLLALLEKSGSLEDIVQLEQALSEVTYEIEKLTGTLRSYDSLISYMTITIDLKEVTRETEISKAPVTLGERISSQFHDTMNGLGAFGEGFLIFLVGCSPILLLIAAIVTAVLLLVRRSNKKRDARRKKEEENAGNQIPDARIGVPGPVETKDNNDSNEETKL